ncbi:MAG: chlorite dismutase family protein [Candidatus Methylacidiphilales bacterium]|nr:chlorite dismutase family protein [Candidatus Methylacidiphilales bacterium]
MSETSVKSETASASPSADAGDGTIKPLVPEEGWGVLHLFYQINRMVWESLEPSEQRIGRERLQAVVAEVAAVEKYRVIPVSMLGRADLGFMIVGPDFHIINALEKKIGAALGAGVLDLVYSFLSLTEKSEYTQTEEFFVDQLKRDEGIEPGHPEFDKRLAVIRGRLRSYTYDRMYPTLPDWEYFCFYPMRKKRDADQNWYALEFEKRRDLMQGHARVGRKYAGRVRQLVSGCAGLDDWEWGVTLFSRDPVEIKRIVYEMRFDEVSYGYAEFGPFYNGLPLPLPEIFKRLLLN